MACLKLTKKVVDDLPYTQYGQDHYWDTELRGFGIVIGKTKKSYVCQGYVNRKSRRVIIGAHGLYTPETARKAAKDILVKMSKGISPTEEKRKASVKGLTLKEAFRNYEKARKSKLKSGTWTNYQDFIENHLSDWKEKALKEISTDMIEKRHAKITTESGKYAANHTLKFLQTLYNFSQVDIPDLIDPVRVLTRKKIWHPKERRTSYIKNHQIRQWYDAVCILENESFRDALILLLFTGLREQEAFSLKWSDVDFKDKSIKILNTKNRKPLILPLTDFLLQLLERRFKTKKSDVWVFPGEGKKGHITEGRRAVRKVIDTSGVQFMIHDLRRTFITIAESLDISTYVLKSLVNHSTSGDVTAGYTQISNERKAQAAQKITDKIKELIEKS